MSAIEIQGLPEPYKAWVIRTHKEFGVGIEAEDHLQVSEKFAGARLWTSQMFIKDKPINMLLLTSDKESLRMEFSVICAHFVEPGENGENRRLLLSAPQVWWNRWRSLLGNRNSERAVHGVLGELIAFYILLQGGFSPNWLGASGGAVDLVTEERDYEIKSTISRYESTVQIAGQFQLNRNTNKPLSMLFFRFEPSADGYCINNMVEKIVSAGADRSYIESELSGLGLERGTSARNHYYVLHEIRHYEIDENFPGITLKSFVGGKIPERVKHLTYSIDLTGIEYDTWEIK
mgnify:FL=1